MNAIYIHGTASAMHCCSHCATPGRFAEDDDREHLCETCAAIKREELEPRHD